MQHFKVLVLCESAHLTFPILRTFQRRSVPIRREKTQHGFTLIELMITVAIVAVLAAIAVPSYRNYVMRGRLTEAHSQLAALGASLQQYYQDNRSYVGACGAAGSGLAALPDSTNMQFTFSCPTLTATNFVANATGKVGGIVSGFTFSLAETGVRQTTAAPTGWVTSTNCWVLSSSGTC